MRYYFLGILLFLLVTPVWAPAQPEAGLIRFTEARSHRIRGSVELPGTVESRRVSTVATEIEGLVEDFPVREGQIVKAGEVLAQLGHTSLELQLRASEAQLEEDEARKKLAERTMQRASDLYERGVYSRQQLDDALFEFNAWQGRSRRLQAEIEQLKYDLERSTIRAPYRGVIVQESTQVGEWIEKGGAVVELLSLEHFEVAVDLPERYYNSIQPGFRAQVSFESQPGLQVEGVISAIIPRADLQARTFPVKLSIPNEQGRVGVGMLARVRLPLGESQLSTVVPKDAVVTRGEQQFVYLIGNDGSVHATPVRTGTGVGQWVEVQGPIQSGEKVVTVGNERLMDGQKVRPQLQEYPFP